MGSEEAFFGSDEPGEGSGQTLWLRGNNTPREESHDAVLEGPGEPGGGAGTGASFS